MVAHHHHVSVLLVAQIWIGTDDISEQQPMSIMIQNNIGFFSLFYEIVELVLANGIQLWQCVWYSVSTANRYTITYNCNVIVCILQTTSFYIIFTEMHIDGHESKPAISILAIVEKR